jgi:hypothetical protein
MAKSKTKSARESFAELGDLQDQRREKIRAQLADGMSENLERISIWLDRMLEDERKLNLQFNGLDPHKLKEFYFGGWELERVSWLRISPVTFEIGLAYYPKEQVEQMPGFKKLVQACASDAIDMDLRIVHNPGRASNMVEINFEKSFDRNGPYKDMLPKPATAKAKGPKAV